MKVANIVQTIEDWASREPDRVVYCEGQVTYTYGQLAEWSDKLAAYLDATIKSKAPIVVYGELEFEMLVAFLAASKTGRAYIPIESSTPKDRVELILSVAQPALIISIGDWQELATSIPITNRETVNEIISAESLIYEKQPVMGDQTYYIIFTSGTTGVPKGVQISHDNLVSFVNWELSDFNLREGLQFLSQAPYSFDLSVMGVYSALTSGGSLAPLKKSVINDFKALFTTLPKLDINVWVSTPSFMKICLMEPTFDGHHVPSIERFLFCGEELPKKTAVELLQRFPEAEIYNTYGPTEATVAISGVLVTSELMETYNRVPIGYVKEDTQVFFMDPDSETIIENGQMGEIIISGPSVSKGYLNNPEKTQAAFFEYQGQPAYRTGDCGRVTEDGLLLYEGRIDFQVKFHGYRIELEDIDHHLSSVSLVKQAVVVPKYQEHKVEQLIAYVVPEAHSYEKEFQLTKAIKESLSEFVMDYMIPQRFVYVDQLLQTPNGKIDRKSLINEVNP
ncbi:D-alanine--poly(phosphoribitol) ligase subunit 1 [Enterococcus sp. JM4C]|uniref:D-alanine--poly(phosphoribitol) ligase subunit DltA n=1 Tax=Candidatus Enterococcus huntleyi TaxID=1857217 RepID=UPI00137A4C63|nr:D-alanine--poly(phosphoribitol) ligase subunit DltA [Enterococcus sp. JM4C]KAF1298146.1 D-alanine--poly(phosphoribitol) ligase subunit 1 [Enterococcus sp. JM4C]